MVGADFKWRGLIVVLLGAVVACAKQQSGAFGPRAYVHHEYPYSVAYVGSGPSQFLSADWALDNYQWKKNAPSKLKQGGEYELRRHYDTDDDGNVDEHETAPVFDLLFRHVHKDAEIWLRTVPISKSDTNKELAVLAQRYVDAVSGEGTVLVRSDEAHSRRYATKILSQGACAVGGHPAFRIDFEVANVDQLQLTPNARWSRGRIVLIQTAFRHSVGRRKDRVPVVMHAGLSSEPADFERMAGDFEHLLDHVAFAERKQDLERATSAATTCRALPQTAALPSASAAQPAGAAPSQAPPAAAAPAPSAEQPAEGAPQDAASPPKKP